MKFLNIEKDGISNVVDEELYQAVYKPAGWKIVREETVESDKNTNPADEIIKKNVNKMKRATQKPFDDNLLKGEKNGEI